jgi:predicted nucleic acid-binding protein
MGKIIVDSCVYIALIREEDSQHHLAESLFSTMENAEIIVPDCVYMEVLNVLKSKTDLLRCGKFLQLIEYLDTEISFNNPEESESAGRYFFQQNQLSFQDCLLLATAKLKKADLLTFDKALQSAWNRAK